MDRKQQLADWARIEIAGLASGTVPEQTLESLSGDASFRRYFRTRTNGDSFILVDAPPDTEDNPTFVQIADTLRAGGVVTPRIFAADYDRGFMLQEDFGDQLYLQALQERLGNPEQVSRLYRLAIDTLVKLQKNVATDPFPVYDMALLQREMQLFEDWFCSRFLAIDLSSDELQLIRNCRGFLADSALSQPQVVVHRDYHSRNLMIPDEARFGAEPGPAVIDFQDAVVGAYTYDLVSLLRDCYISWPLIYVQELARYYRRQAVDEGVIGDISEAAFMRHFDLMGLQRNLKVIGIFARLCIRDDKPQFLADIPQTMRYLLRVAANYPELAGFLEWFERRIVPLAKQRLPAANS